ncbi:MAG TPA: methyltransferase domain-containing protein [Planctomycetaceae bacterium]|nr:methyltransferase domain-containing protein [Planctomycetaceae bacterium]
MADQTWNPERYVRNAAFVPELGRAVVEWLAPRPGERILDLGCGDGALTAELAAAGCDVVGVDSSPDQVAAARARGLDARVLDATRLAFDAEFDAVFSNAVLHWIKTPGEVIAGVARALRAGGRFVGEFGGAGNVARIEAALGAALQRRGIDTGRANPWYFPTPDEYTAELAAHGLRVGRIELIPRPTPLPTGIIGWLETFAEPFTSAVPDAGRAGFLREVEEALRPNLCDAGGTWVVDYVRLRFAATLS